jgi:hypothetical protein
MTLPEFRRAVVDQVARANDVKARAHAARLRLALRHPKRTRVLRSLPTRASRSAARTACAAVIIICSSQHAQEAGNALFKDGDMEGATQRYVEALDLLAGALEVPALRRPDMGDLLRRAHAAHAACHLNLAACALKARLAS